MKMAKRSLAVLLALLMTFSVFSVSGSAYWNAGSAGIVPETAEGAGTVTYGLDVYKDGTKVEQGSTLSPGDVIEVRVSFSTDFYTFFLQVPVYFDSTYFTPAIDGVPYTARTDGFTAGLIKTYEGQVATSTELNNASGAPAEFYDTLLDITTGGRICHVNKTTTRDKVTYFPLFMKEGYAEGTATNKSAVTEEYATYNELITAFGCGPGNNANNMLMKIPYDCYYSFQLIVNDDVDSGDATTLISIPALAARVLPTDPACQTLISNTNSEADSGSATSTEVGYGHGYDVTNAEFECKIGTASTECEHDWGEGEVTTAATCTEDGVRTFTCSKCNETKTEVIPATGHTEETIPGKAATCTETGLTDGVKCSVCGEILTAQDEIPMTSHTPSTVAGKAATCTETGLTDGSVCSVCGTVLTAQDTIPALGHTWGEWTVEKEATTTEEGIEKRVCSVCGETETRPIEKLPETEANYTVTVYTMDTTGNYVAGTPETRTGTIGEVVSVNAEDYLTTGFTVSSSSVTSATLAESGTELTVYLDRVISTFDFKIDNGDGTYTTYEQGEYYYGTILTLPEAPAKEGYTFKYWAINGEKFDGGIVERIGDFEVIAVYEKDLDPSQAATEEELAALDAAIAALPDAVNLYYYTDEAILWVANALGGSYKDADAFLAASAAGYTYEGEKSSVAVNAATAELTRLMVVEKKDPRYDETVLGYFDESGEYPVAVNRAESKANVQVTVVPTAVNGVKITADRNLSVQPGDDITFGIYVTTDYYFATFCLPIVFDANYFAPFESYEDDGGNTVKEIYSYNTTAFPGALDPSEGNSSSILNLSGVSRTLTSNYDIECDTLICAAGCYPLALRTDDYMNQFKYVIYNCTPKAKTNAVALKLDNTLVGSITLTTSESIPTDGSVTSLVGCPSDWYATAAARTNKLCVPRACGYMADGTTPALGGGSNHPFANSLYDVCAQFDQTYTAELTAVTFGAAHIHTEEEIPAVPATCTSTGLTAGVKCSVCGEILVAQEIVPMTAHTPVIIPAVEATCTSTGLTAGMKCDVCGLIMTAQEEVPMKEHVPTVVPAVPATCTSTGLTEGSKCANCDKIFVEQTIVEKLAHTPSVIPAVPATCTSTGLTEGSKCAVCGEILKAQEVVQKIAHTPSVIPAVPATCTSTGLTEGSKCAVCGEILKAQEIVQKIAHTPTLIASEIPATCTKTGMTSGSKCAVCDTILVEQEVIPMIPHTPVTVPGKAATCTETGLTDGSKCSVCGTVLTAQEVIPASGHQWGEWIVVKEATEKEEGLEKRVCAVCGVEETRKIEKLPATELTLTDSINKKPGKELSVTVTYGRRGKTAFQLTSSVENTKYEVKSNGKHQAFTIDENGNVKFVRMSILSKNKTATIVATSPDGQTATCKVTYKMKWWQYLIWMIFGTFWF